MMYEHKIYNTHILYTILIGNIQGQTPDVLVKINFT